MTGEDTSAVDAVKVLFDEGQYGDCLSALNTMANTTNSALAVKIQLNMVLCQYLQKDSEHDLDWLLDNLYTIEGKMRKEGEDEACDEVERSVLLYNTALVLYQRKQFDKALEILRKLFKLIEPLEESLAYKICFLLVECYLCTYQTEDAAMVLYYLDKQFTGSKEPLTPELHRARMHQYRTRLYAQQRCLKACKREIKNVLTVSGTTASSLFLKSEFEYLRSNFKKSCKLLNSSPKTCPSKENIPTLYYNNFGCMHFKMKKYNLGALYLSQALEANCKAVKAIPKGGNTSTVYSVNHFYQLLYNYGILLLHTGQPNAAFNCLTEAASVYTRNPRLWLRIAECAIGVCREQKEATPPTHSNTVKCIVGSGAYRKTILNTSFQQQPKRISADLVNAGPTPSLTYAVLCLNNAMDLLPPGAESVKCLPAAPVKDPSGLRASVLCKLAYVWLELGDPLQAIKPAQSLIELDTAPVDLRLLGCIYAAEANILMDKTYEATCCLSRDLVERIKQSSAAAKGGPEGGVEDLSELTSTIILNSVALHCMKRDLNKAKRILVQHLSTLRDDEHPLQATMLLVYIELRQGNTENALSILKQQQCS